MKQKIPNYNPIVKDLNFAGTSLGYYKGGETATIRTKGFITSFEPNFNIACRDFVMASLENRKIESVNELLVHVKSDGKAYIYENFPKGYTIVLNKTVRNMELVFDNDIADIESVFFKDTDFELDFKKGDKLLWLFRSNWNFGFYYDCSSTLELFEIEKELGIAYKILKYYEVFSFLENEQNFDVLLQKGWFPFIDLVSNQFITLVHNFEKKEIYPKYVETLINEYTPEKLDRLCEKWWNNKYFQIHRDVLQSGIELFNMNNQTGNIGALKVLITELEGIIRHVHNDTSDVSPRTSDLKKLIYESATKKYTSINSLTFPEYFVEYLSKVIFRRFDLNKNDVKISRNTVAHGIANTEEYTRERALQIILSLDQIYYYL